MKKVKKPLSQFQQAMKIKRERVKQKAKLEKECMDLWQQVVKKRAGNRCEMTGQMGILNAHHIFHKGSYPHLKYNPDNGACLELGQHFKVHQCGEADLLLQLVRIRGVDWYEKLLENKISNANVQYSVEILEGIKLGLLSMLNN